MFTDKKSLNDSGEKETTEAEKILMDQVYTVTQAAEAFVKDTYYTFLDSNRAVMLKLYKDNSVCIWNGTECKGLSNIEKLLSELPTTSHKVESYDAQPIAGADKKVTNILINVNGKVTYQATANHAFQQTLILAKDPTTQNYYLQHDCIRLTS